MVKYVVRLAIVLLASQILIGCIEYVESGKSELRSTFSVSAECRPKIVDVLTEYSRNTGMRIYSSGTPFPKINYVLANKSIELDFSDSILNPNSTVDVLINVLDDNIDNKEEVISLHWGPLRKKLEMLDCTSNWKELPVGQQ